MSTKPPFEIVYGVVGYKAVGKGVFTDAAVADGFAAYTLSTPLKVLYKLKHGHENWQTEDLMAIGDSLRGTYGPGHLASETLMLASQAGHRRIVIDGLRNPGEVETLQRLVGERVVLVGISAPTMTRFGYCLARGKSGDPTTIEGFLAMDDKDRGVGQPVDGQQVDRTMALVPPEQIYQNVGTKAEFQDWTRCRIKMDIVSLVIHRPSGALPPGRI